MIIHNPNPFGANNQTPDRVVVHAMAEKLDMGDKGIMDAADFLLNIGLSAHALIKTNGDIIVCRDDTQGAWHAKGFNTDSLGIEFLVPDVTNYADFIEKIKTDWVSEEQLQVGSRWLSEWCARWNIKRIDGHCDIDPDRKQDPGTGFPWQKLRESVGDYWPK